MFKTNKEPLESRGCINTTVLYILIFLAFTSGVFHTAAGDIQYPEGPVKVHEAWLQIAALAVSAGISIYQGIKQNQAAKELEKINERPEYRVSQGTRANLALAKVAANEGLPAQAYNNYLNQLQLGTSSALRNNLLYGGGNTNTNTVVRAYNEGVQELNAADEQARRRGRSELMQANEALAEEERRAFQWDAEQYRDRMNWAAELRRAGNENIMAGIGSGLGAVASGAFNKAAATTSKPAQTSNSANITPSTAMRLSERGITAGLQGDYDRLVQKQLRERTSLSLRTPDGFWRTAGTLR